MSPATVEWIGSVAAVLGTLCWLPQTAKILRHRRTDGVSVITNAMLLVAVMLWVIYGVYHESWPIIIANAVSAALIAAILGMKLRIDGLS